MRYFFILTIVLTCFSSLSQDESVVNTRILGGSGFDYSTSVIETEEGGYLVGGYSSSNASGVKTENSFGGLDYWVLKLSYDLEIEWQRTIGYGFDDSFSELVSALGGGYFLAGTKYQNSNNSSSVALVVKLDNEGNTIWESEFGSTYLEPKSVCASEDGGCVVASLNNFAEITITKLNYFGTTEWQMVLVTNGFDQIGEIQPAHGGGFVIAGSSLVLGQDRYGWVFKLNDLGSVEWQSIIDGSDAEYFYSVKSLPDNGYIVAGSSNSSITAGVKSENSQGAFDYWILKLDSSGNIEWENTIGGSSVDEAFEIHQAPVGGYIVGGNSHSDVSGDKGEDSQFEDIWIVKIDAAGNVEWENTIGGNFNEYKCTLFPTQYHSYIVCAATSSTDFGNPALINYENYDYWVLNINPDGLIGVYSDSDNDGFGDPSNYYFTSIIGIGVLNGDDCNDSSPAINPTALEICNNIDDDCDGETDEPDFHYYASFDGVNDYLECGSDDIHRPIAQLTVECWAYRDNWSGTNRSIVSCTQTGGYAIATFGTGVRGFVRRNNAYGDPQYNGQLSSGWHHFALTYDGRYSKLYIDGELVATNDAGAVYPIQYGCDTMLLIAAEPTCTSISAAQYFNGSVDDVRIWSYSRNLNEINSFKNHQLTGNEPGLISYLNMFPVTIDAFTFVLNQADGPGAQAMGGTQFATDAYFNEGSPELCNGLDDNCNGEIDEGLTDLDNDGAPACVGDCDDEDASVNPYMPEICNFIDDDCDGETDELDFGNATFLNGNADYINLGGGTAFAPVNEITVELWAYRSVWSGADRALISKTQNGGYSIYTDNTGLETYLHRNGSYAILHHTTPLESGWHHIALTFDGRYTRLIVDGVESDSDDAGSIVPITYQCNNNNLLLGFEPTCTGVSSGSAYFIGLLDEVRIWSYARSNIQLHRFKTHELSGNELGLLGYWKLNEEGFGAGVVVENSAANYEHLDGVTVGNSVQFTQSNIYITHITTYLDLDQDGYGDPSTEYTGCFSTSLSVSNDDDCDDTNPNIHPGAAEICNALDDDCDGLVDEGMVVGCTDNTACNFNSLATCNAGCTYPDTLHPDADGDGYGDPTITFVLCEGGAGLIKDDADCDDTRADVHPDAPGTAEGIDNNCNGVIDPAEESADCFGDLNDDGAINVSDLLLFAGMFGCTSACGVADLNSDGVVNTSDLLLFTGAFGGICP